MIESLASLRAQFATQPPKLSSQFDEHDPRKLNHLSLEQQKKRAKELLREWRTHPLEPEGELKLNNAQHVIAQEYGFTNWSKLKAHIVQAQIAREALNSGEPSALDFG